VASPRPADTDGGLTALQSSSPLGVSTRGDPVSADAVVSSDLGFIVARAKVELEQMSGLRLLITGGAGFLGYYLVQAVVAWNYGVAARDRIEVTVLDNFARGIPAWLGPFAGEQLALVEHDVSRPLPQGLGDFDYVVHAAGIASPTFYRRHPLETMDANVIGLRQFLDRAVEQTTAGHPLSGLLFFSSSEIYGDPPPEQIPTPETYRGNVSCTGPRACYDESKRYGETLCVTFARHYGVPVTIARPFNNYGPGLKITDRRVLPDLARNVLEGEDVTLLSDGTATRTFCYVADAVVGYLKVLVHGRPGEPYNIGTEEPEVSMREVAERVAAIARDLFGYAGRVVRSTSDDAQYLVDNPTRRRPSIAKARDELGYEPSVDLDDGLHRSLVWYAGHCQAADA
jgi:UDP-glucuronate decarboxylase